VTLLLHTHTTRTNSDWNPQNDVQAMARCHRIGQTKSVRVYRLITRGSFEAEMFARASRKLGLEQAVLGNPGQVCFSHCAYILYLLQYSWYLHSSAVGNCVTVQLAHLHLCNNAIWLTRVHTCVTAQLAQRSIGTAAQCCGLCVHRVHTLWAHREYLDVE
jgi:hypothetical protein